jgi:Undecaprenyl-phosphate glucose phosphotransferase
MLKKNAQFFESLFFISDLLILSLAWVLSYFLRFNTTLIKPPLLGTPPFVHYIEYLFPLWGIWALVSKKMNLYRPRRFEPFSKELIDLAKTLALTFFILMAILYLFKSFEFSRLAFLYFLAISFVGLASARFVLRKILRMFRRKGYNQRQALIAGTGELGQKLLEKMELCPELGIHIMGFLTRKTEQVGEVIRNVPVIGGYEDVDQILHGNKIDIFFIALGIDEYSSLPKLIRNTKGFLSDVKVVPGACEFITLRGGIDELDGLPIVSLQNSPLYGWNKFFKRAFDLIVGMAMLIILSPVMFVVSLLVKGTSGGPVFYRQTRIGMDGRPFQMLKFRTMRADAEKETGPVWANENDPRRTTVGRFLRKTSLDELPQLFNVLKGEMSLVGPRPERPNFVEEFRNGIPSYMLRHKIKAGMTGWAQVNGWRGRTSLEKRIEHDLYYIQNWSIGFDLKILFRTLWSGFFSKSAY